MRPPIRHQASCSITYSFACHTDKNTAVSTSRGTHGALPPASSAEATWRIDPPGSGNRRQVAFVKALTMSRRSSRHATLRQAAAVLSTALQYAVANIDYGDRFTGFPSTLPTIVPPPRGTRERSQTTGSPAPIPFTTAPRDARPEVLGGSNRALAAMRRHIPEGQYIIVAPFKRRGTEYHTIPYSRQGEGTCYLTS